MVARGCCIGFNSHVLAWQRLSLLQLGQVSTVLNPNESALTHSKSVTCCLLMYFGLDVRRSRASTVKVNAREEATLELDEGVEGGADYSGLLAGASESTHQTAL